MLGESNGRRGGESVEEQGGVDVGEILMMPPGASGEMVFMAGDEGCCEGEAGNRSVVERKCADGVDVPSIGMIQRSVGVIELATNRWTRCIAIR